MFGISVTVFSPPAQSGVSHRIEALAGPETMDLGGGATMQKVVYQQAGVGEGSGPFDDKGPTVPEG